MYTVQSTHKDSGRQFYPIAKYEPLYLYTQDISNSDIQIPEWATYDQYCSIQFIGNNNLIPINAKHYNINPTIQKYPIVYTNKNKTILLEMIASIGIDKDFNLYPNYHGIFTDGMCAHFILFIVIMLQTFSYLHKTDFLLHMILIIIIISANISRINAQTSGPTFQPTRSPTYNPTNNPSYNPSYNPTISPSYNPSYIPTLSPSNNPTFQPTPQPTPSPTFQPTHSPTYNPTNNPSYNPTISPSYNPTISPSYNPTYNPTLSPSITPTTSPSQSPSNYPSASPTIPPTQNPISYRDFDSYMPITYVFENIRSTNDNDYLLKIANAPLNETEYIEFVIKDKYYTKGYIKYENYMVQILDIGGVKIDEINQHTKIKWSYLDQVELFTNIECNEDDGCEFIKTKSQSNTEFTDEVQTELRNYTGIQNLLFSVKNAKKITIICKNCEKDINYPLYVLSSIGGLIVILSFCAFMFNKGKFPKCAGFNIVDDGKWVALIIFGLQVYDFYSDINLSIEISSRDDFLQDIIILIAGLGSIFFILVPYIANLIIAARIKDIIKGNAAAKGWFQYNTPIFTVLVVLSGGAHAALSLVSSQIFGLTIMSCGLTQYELNKLGKLKVIGTVLIENIPQLICQTLYTTRLDGNITDAVKLAFVASSLSVIASTLSYLIEKDTSDTSAVQYYVSTQCAFRLDKEDSNYHEGTLMSIKKQHSRAFSTTKEYDEIKEDEKNDEALSNECIITNEEKQNIIDNRGRTERLGENLAEVFGIPTKNIEVGHSMLTKRGVITHIIHYVYDEDLETMEEELMIENITPRLFVSKLFDLLQVDIHRVFKDHFQLNDDFQVSFNCRLGIIKRTLVQQNNINNENQNKINLNRVTSRRNIVLKQMISRHLSHSNMLQQTNLELNAINTLRKLFVDKQKNTVNEQLNLCSTLIKKINNDMIKPVHLESSMKHINKLDDTNDDIEIDKLVRINGLEKAISNDVVHDELDLQIEMGVLNPQISTAI